MAFILKLKSWTLSIFKQRLFDTLILVFNKNSWCLIKILFWKAAGIISCLVFCVSVRLDAVWVEEELKGRNIQRLGSSLRETSRSRDEPLQNQRGSGSGSGPGGKALQYGKLQLGFSIIKQTEMLENKQTKNLWF